LPGGTEETLVWYKSELFNQVFVFREGTKCYNGLVLFNIIPNVGQIVIPKNFLGAFNLNLGLPSDIRYKKRAEFSQRASRE